MVNFLALLSLIALEGQHESLNKMRAALEMWVTRLRSIVEPRPATYAQAQDFGDGGRTVLTSEQIERYERDGYLLLRGQIDEAGSSAVSKTIRRSTPTPATSSGQRRAAIPWRKVASPIPTSDSWKNTSESFPSRLPSCRTIRF
jgi:hypothetical protein